MTVVYEDEWVTLHHADYRDVLDVTSDNALVADAIITDPPYGDTSFEWDRWPTGWLKDAAHLTDVLWCFGSFGMFHRNAADFADWKLSQEIVWEKHNGSGFHADRFKRVHELAVLWYRGDWADLRDETPTTADATPRTVRRKTRPAHTGHIEDSAYRSEDGGPRLMRSVQYVRSEHGAMDGQQSMTAPANRRHVEAGMGNLPEIIGYHLLPTPDASNANDGEQLDTWVARRERVKLTANNGNGMGMLLAIAALTLLPTPQVADATGGHARRGGDRSDELLLPGVAEAATSGALLPTPRASRGASSTETMYALGAERDDAGDAQGNVTGPVSWGKYEPAIRHWEALTRPAVSPTRPDGKNGRDRLNPELSEWFMGYPLGWVTSVIGRDPAIKACGNGVLPHQAFAALGILWSRASEWAVAA